MVYVVFAEHHGQNKRHYGLRRFSYWLYVAADAVRTVWSCGHCAWSRMKLQKHLHRLKLFSATPRLQSVAIGILGLLRRIRTGKLFSIDIKGRLPKPRRTSTLSTTTLNFFATAFCEFEFSNKDLKNRSFPRMGSNLRQSCSKMSIRFLKKVKSLLPCTIRKLTAKSNNPIKPHSKCFVITRKSIKTTTICTYLP